eukprot:77604_1
MDRPLLYRQKSMEVLAAKQAIFGCVIQLAFLSPAIAAVVIAFDYNKENSACADGTKYTIDLQEFLWWGGGIQLVYGLFYLVLQCVVILVMKSDARGTGKGDSCLGLWLMVWAAIGLYMWDNQFSDACKDERIAQMILAWSIIPFATIALVCCGACCLIALSAR